MAASTREHNVWLSLLEISGPFLSNRVLEDEFHEGLDAADPELNKLLRAVYDVWLTSQDKRPPDSAEHSRWVLYVLAYILGMPLLRVDDHDPQAVGLKRGPALSQYRVYLPEHRAELSPAYALFVRNTTPSLLIQEYNRDQKLDESIEHETWHASPATRMETLLQATKVPLGLVTNGEQWMLVHTLPNITTSFVTWHAHLWLEEPITLQAFRSLLHLHRFASLAAEKSLLALLEKSADDQQEVTIELGKQVRQAVEVWLQALNRINKATLERTFLYRLNEASIYEAALTVMMRLVFLLYAEERRLLPLGTSQLYDQNYAASTLLQQLRERASKQADTYMEKRFDAWSRLLTLFRIVYNGVEHQDLSLRAYGGDLFDPDRFPFLEGRAPYTSWQEDDNDPLPIDNRTVMHLLEALQLLRTGGSREARRLSFRALDVEQIGHVYEGLLDHTAKRAIEPLLSLKGKQHSSAEVALATLETAREQKGEDGLLDLLEKETERQRSTLKKELAQDPDIFEQKKLRAACENDEALFQRVLPYTGLLRHDSFGFPLVILPGFIYMTQGSDRRSTGTHYTPRTLTVPMVRYTLEPLVYTGPAEGWEVDRWQLRSAGEILGLKICDMAVGSGAFLVQSCRYLAEHLMEAWEAAAEKYPGMPQIAPEGLPSEGADGETLLPIDAEERRALAQRIIAERCLYGVDKNHLAIEMAKLSLWLITLSKDLPFTFLNHALREGDSLLGVSDINQFKRWSTQTQQDKPETLRFVEMGIEDALKMAQKLRSEIRRLPDNTAQDLKVKKRKLQQVDEATELVKLGADLFTLLNQLEYTQEKYPTLPNELEYLLLVNTYQEAHQGYNDIERHKTVMVFEEMRDKVNKLLGERDPFHWPLEFPETFVQTLDEPGFDALLSNPPFQGGKRITGTLETDYREYLVKHLAYGKRGNADLCAYFFLRATSLVRIGGQSAMLATNSIAQGDTREVGLDQIASMGWTIPRAVHSLKWPGSAALEVAYVWLRHGRWQGEYILDDKPVKAITPFLTPQGRMQGKPYTLVANRDRSFQGSIVLGMGFVLKPEEAQELIEKDSYNRDVVFPYLNGEDLNSRPDQSPSRWVINFHDWPLKQAENYTDCMRIVREKVKPGRDLLEMKTDASAKGYAKLWWLYGRRGIDLYRAIAQMERVLVIALTSRTCAFAFAPSNIVFSHATGVFAFDKACYLAFLQSSFHVSWTFNYGSSMKGDLRYTPSDCFENFPFPENLQELNTIGEEYDQHRQSIMLSRQEGLTQTYNRFHNPHETASDIVRLRELHREMDEAVAKAYGWEDLDLGHGFHETRQGIRYTISEEARNEVLGRLLTLNHERYEEEVKAGLHDKGAKKGKGAAAKAKARGKGKDGNVVREETAYGLVEQGKLLLE
jgi:hypothetical protein